MKAIFLAGGLGTRLRAAVQDVPKPLAPIRGRPFLDLLMDYWIGYGVTELYLSVGYLSEKVLEFVENHPQKSRITLVIENEPLGTGGGLKHVLKETAFDEGWLINGDTFFEVNPEQIFDFHHENHADLTLTLRSVSKNDRYSCVERDDKNQIIGISRNSSLSEQWINGGVYYLGQSFVRHLKSLDFNKGSLEDEVIPNYLKDHRVFGFPQKARFIDIGVVSDYQKAQDFFQPHEAHSS